MGKIFSPRQIGRCKAVAPFCAHKLKSLTTNEGPAHFGVRQWRHPPALPVNSGNPSLNLNRHFSLCVGFFYSALINILIHITSQKPTQTSQCRPGASAPHSPTRMHTLIWCSSSSLLWPPRRIRSAIETPKTCGIINLKVLAIAGLQ